MMVSRHPTSIYHEHSHIFDKLTGSTTIKTQNKTHDQNPINRTPEVGQRAFFIGFKC